MHLAVIIPALNEELNVGNVIKAVRKLDAPEQISRTSVIVVDDGSTDNTVSVSKAAGAEIVSHNSNRGVGAAFQTGIAVALSRGAEIIVNIDADEQFNPEDINTLLGPILRGEADFVSASRFKDPELIPEMPAIKLWGNRQMSRLVSLIVGRRFHDVSCGFRAYSRETALRLNLWGDFTYTQESFIDLSAKGMRIEEVAVKVRGVREIGESRVASNLWRYGRKTFMIIFHAFRDFWPMRFFIVISGLAAVPGLALLAFLFLHYIRTKAFSPHIWAGFVGGGFLSLAILCFITGLLASMLRRIRLNQEEILYFLRHGYYDKRD